MVNGILRNRTHIQCSLSDHYHQEKPLEISEVKKFMTYFAYMKNEKGEEKNEFFNSFINRVILYDDKVIILYNSNDREIKRLNKKQLKEIETAENLEEIKENSLEPSGFKRVSLGGERGIRTRKKQKPNH